MYMLKKLALALGVIGLVGVAGTNGAGAQSGYPLRFDFGTTPSAQELAKFFAIPPDGRGLPAGRGGYEGGKKVYMEQCSVCHGEKGEGIPQVGGDRLLGGRGTLATATAAKTVESYWPYATSVWDFVKRAMPFQAPGSMSNDDVYAVVAYILAEANIIQKTDVLDAASLPKVMMPNRNGFIPDPRPELGLYR